MARKKRNGAAESEAGNQEEPTVEAAGSEEVVEETTEEVPGGAAVMTEEVIEEPEMEEVTVEATTLEDVSPKVKGVKPKKMFRIIIDEQDNTDKNGPVRCTDGQGKQYLIKRGFEVNVPEGVVNVIKESVFTVYDKDEGDNDIERHIPRFAMRIIKEL